MKATRYPSLNGKTVIVIGGAGGIGSAIVKGFLKQGSGVHALDRNQKALCALVASVSGDICLVRHTVDVQDHDSLKAFIHKIGKESKAIDCLVYAAGIGAAGSSVDFSEGLPEKLFMVNVIGFMQALKYVIPFMRERSSAIAIGSINAFKSEIGMAVYDATKAALHQFCLTAAAELGPGIRVNVVAPGYIRTPQTEEELKDPNIVERIVGASSLQRIGKPGDIASVVVAMASDDFSFMTGSVVSVDGGLALAQYAAIPKQKNI